MEEHLKLSVSDGRIAGHERVDELVLEGNDIELGSNSGTFVCFLLSAVLHRFITVTSANIIPMFEQSATL